MQETTSFVYHITGMLQAALFFLSISAVYVQLRFVRQRRCELAQSASSEPATDNLSVVAISGAFAAFFSFLLLSTATEPFAHYIFWSRLPACILAVMLLWEFRRDRSSGKSALTGPIAAAMLLTSLLLSAISPETNRSLISEIQLFVLLAGVLLVGGQIHQLWLLISRQRVGALSLKARALNFLKDISTIAFCLALGVHQSWSLIVVAGANAAVTALVIFAGLQISDRASHKISAAGANIGR